ncbi:MAG: undecaprenyl/decaprenyl-phosphate alpha-N-acetylglucosaminyl 1-phosphate transferase [Solirubrobacterales bacterium]|nr:undecaprenyl/decaprenyl-phosphate alpha-N-acetylglucosaminyl 1-phosphate transferase [Solirubrobacterales bacterium]
MRYSDAVFAFVVALAVATLLTPVAARLAWRVGAVAKPSERGLATRDTPLLGGLAILAGVLVASAIWLPSTFQLQHVVHGKPGPGPTVDIWMVLAGACVITLVGAIDDAIDLSPPLKLLGQIGAAVIAVEGGAVVTDVTLPFIGALQFPNTGGVLTVIWLVALMNVVNFSDGVDGLAAGLCTIDGVAFSVIAFDLGVNNAAVMAALTAGAAMGFLFHNFHPAAVFMGDSGANLLGYMLGVVAVLGSLKTNVVVALVVPLVILAVPFLDGGFVVAKRLKYRRKPWSGDTNHFHHRMARIGFSPRRTVAYLYAWTLMLAGVAIALRFVPYSDHHGHYRLGWALVMGIIGVVALAASVYLVYVLEILKFRHRTALKLREDNPDTSEHQIDAAVRRDLETGEFERVGR